MDTGAKRGGNVLMSDSPVRFDPKTIPAEINRWNWGAFLLNWIWGIGNQTYIALLALIPGFGFIWSWYKRVQRKWAIWGAIIWIAVPALFGAGIGGIFFGLKHSAAYEMAVAKLQADPVAVNVLGSPISTGTPYGEISVDGSSGKAELSFSATGPKAAGVVFVEAVKKEGVWSITRLAFKLNDSDKVTDLLGGAKGDTT
jgi:Cytochrome oxidase complex assembly protein 1